MLVAESLSGPLTRIINGSITEAYFPKLWKIANPMKNDELRQIAISPVFSKVFERLLGWQMLEFTNSASLHPDNIM